MALTIIAGEFNFQNSEFSFRRYLIRDNGAEPWLIDKSFPVWSMEDSDFEFYYVLTRFPRWLILFELVVLRRRRC